VNPYSDWEDYKAGMWSNENSGKEEKAKGLLSDPMRLHAAMRSVAFDWPIACEVNLSHPPNNRAWLGQAACCYAVGANEESTRGAWGMLTDPQREQANAIADRVIQEWRYRTRRNPQKEFFWDA
jgi:hypothetical protein